MNGLVVRAWLLIAAAAIVVYWTDNLLRVTERAAELTLNAADLEALARPAPAGEDPPEPAPEVKPAPAESSAAPETSAAPDPPQPRESAAPAATVRDAAAAEATAPSPTLSSTPLPDPPPTPEVADAPPTEALATHFSPGAEGALASFQGSGSASESRQGETTESGQGAAWEIKLAGSANLQDLAAIPGTRLAAVRLQRNYTEVAVTDGHNLHRPTSVDRFVQQYPRHAAGQGVVLERKLMEAIADRLVSYGSGWQLWLLIEDQAFGRWVKQVQEQLAREGTAWTEVARIQASLIVQRGRPPQFVLERIDRRAAAVAAAVERPAGTPGAAEPTGASAVSEAAGLPETPGTQQTPEASSATEKTDQPATPRPAPTAGNADAGLNSTGPGEHP